MNDEVNQDITENDKLMAALSYPIPIVAIVILLSETNKVRPFQKFHAVQALGFWVALTVIGIVVAIITLGIGSLCFPVIWLVSLWPAYKSYLGEYYGDASPHRLHSQPGMGVV